jgi:hypothetical protein
MGSWCILALDITLSLRWAGPPSPRRSWDNPVEIVRNRLAAPAAVLALGPAS